MSISRFAFVVSMAALLLAAPGAEPAHATSKALNCAFVKQRAAVKKESSLLACQRKALVSQTPIDPACVAAATAKLEDTFRKIEARGGCQPEGDIGIVTRVVDRCSQQLEQFLQGACTPTGGLCVEGAPPCCSGLCSGAIGQQAACRG